MIMSLCVPLFMSAMTPLPFVVIDDSQADNIWVKDKTGFSSLQKRKVFKNAKLVVLSGHHSVYYVIQIFSEQKIVDNIPFYSDF